MRCWRSRRDSRGYESSSHSFSGHPFPGSPSSRSHSSAVIRCGGSGRTREIGSAALSFSGVTTRRPERSSRTRIPGSRRGRVHERYAGRARGARLSSPRSARPLPLHGRADRAASALMRCSTTPLPIASASLGGTAFPSPLATAVIGRSSGRMNSRGRPRLRSRETHQAGGLANRDRPMCLGMEETAPSQACRTPCGSSGKACPTRAVRRRRSCPSASPPNTVAVGRAGSVQDRSGFLLRARHGSAQATGPNVRSAPMPRSPVRFERKTPQSGSRTVL